MLKKISFIIFILFSVVLLGYISLPNFDFPKPPPGSLQSKEPADTENPLRRAYFTNYSREEVMDWYKNQFQWGYRLNYPPENASTIIRDQTKSTFLEEIVHPFRESIFINGFEPKDPKDAINIEGLPWRQKIIVRYIPSSLIMRMVVAIATLACLYVLVREYSKYAKRS